MKLNFADYDEYARKSDTPQGAASVLTYADQTFAGRQAALLDKAIAGIVGALSDGTIHAIDYYREKIGELRGLRQARAFLDDAQRFASDAPAEKAVAAPPLYEA